MEIKILNVGEGDLRLSFDMSDASDRATGRDVVTELLRKGFALMVEVGRNEKGPMYQRVHAYDADSCEYIVMGRADEAQEVVNAVSAPKVAKNRPKKARVPASNPVVAVGRTAGGFEPNLPSRVRRGNRDGSKIEPGRAL